MIAIEGLYVHLAVVKSPLRLLLVTWISHIERAFPYLWLIHELDLYPCDRGNLGAIITFQGV